MEKGTYEQIMSHLEKELELSGLEAPDEMPINTVTQQAPQQNLNSPNQRAIIVKNQVTIKISAVNSNERKTKREIIQIVPTTTMKVPKQTLTPRTTKLQAIPKETIQIIKETEELDLSSHPVRHVVELTSPQRNAILEQTQRTDRLHEIEDWKNRTKVNRVTLKTIQMEMSKLQPKL